MADRVELSAELGLEQVREADQRRQRIAHLVGDRLDAARDVPLGRGVALGVPQHHDPAALQPVQVGQRARRGLDPDRAPVDALRHEAVRLDAAARQRRQELGGPVGIAEQAGELPV